jgi:hypothetical protein
MGFLYYFFNMQCPDCGYICFKQAKDCGNCGFDFKKAATSAASLFRNDSFTIFAGSKIPAKGQESSSATVSADSEEIAVMDAPEGSQENPEVESGDFLLNLSDAEQESSATALESTTSDSDTLEFTPLEFGADANINLEEVEVEGLGLGLEPLEDEPSETLPVTSETGSEEISLEISDAPEVVDLAPEDGSSDSPIEIAVDKEPTIEIAPTASPEDEAPALEINDLSAVSLEEKADIENAKEEETPKAPVLDLGEDEISLELDEDPEPESPPTPPVQIDELDLNLKIDDSEGPLSTANTETPEIEIEDLGLELEDSDSPPDSEKP